MFHLSGLALYIILHNLINKYIVLNHQFAKQMCLAQHSIQTIILLDMMLDRIGLKEKIENKG